MAKKSKRTPRSSSKPPNDGSPLGYLSDTDLLRELARRRAISGKLDLSSMELAAEDAKHHIGQESLAAMVAALPQEDASPKPCPKCGRLIPVKAQNRERRVLTLSGEVVFFRNYHYCDRCQLGFAPRDKELQLPEQGDLSTELEKRILDFGVNDTFAAAAERWSVHYPRSISENLVRRVVERVGSLCEAADPLQLQLAACERTPEPARWLVVAGDGSMVCTREAAWKEAKVAVVARGEDLAGPRSQRSGARYVAVVGGQDAFAEQVRAALEAERADEVTKVVWLGDGARENWTLAEALCPLAIQVLDLPHAVQHAMACGKALLGEESALLPLWQQRAEELLWAPGPDGLIRELLECLSETVGEEHLAALDELIGYYRANERRMRYTEFAEMGLPVGSGIVESAHRHVLQVRMKRAGQRWSLPRAHRMACLRATYRTAGPKRFHWAIRHAYSRTRRSI